VQNFEFVSLAIAEYEQARRKGIEPEAFLHDGG
jgi:hypothetical protein